MEKKGIVPVEEWFMDSYLVFNFQEGCLISVPVPSKEIQSVISSHLFLVILNKAESSTAH